MSMHFVLTYLDKPIASLMYYFLLFNGNVRKEFTSFFPSLLFPSLLSSFPPSFTSFFPSFLTGSPYVTQAGFEFHGSSCLSQLFFLISMSFPRDFVNVLI